MTTKIKHKQIKSVEQLRKLSSDEALDCFIALAGGLMRSSKNIFFDGELFIINNDIDGTGQELTAAQLYTDSNIGEAIDKGAFFAY